MTTILTSTEIKNCLIEIVKNEAKNPSGSLAISQDNCEKIVKVVNVYGQRDGLFGKIGALTSRTWNMFLAIFGQSSWQRARKAMISNIEKTVNYSEIKDDDRKAFAKEVKKIAEIKANTILNALIDATKVEFDSKDKVEFNPQAYDKKFETLKANSKFKDQLDQFKNI